MVPQLHFSVDREVAERLAAEAARRGCSVSKLIAEMVARELPQQWPAGYLRSVVGSCKRSPIPLPDDLPLDDVDLETR